MKLTQKVKSLLNFTGQVSTLFFARVSTLNTEITSNIIAAILISAVLSL